MPEYITDMFSNIKYEDIDVLIAVPLALLIYEVWNQKVMKYLNKKNKNPNIARFSFLVKNNTKEQIEKDAKRTTEDGEFTTLIKQSLALNSKVHDLIDQGYIITAFDGQSDIHYEIDVKYHKQDKSEKKAEERRNNFQVIEGGQDKGSS